MFDRARKGGNVIRTVTHIWRRQAIDIVCARRAPNIVKNLLRFRAEERGRLRVHICRASAYDCAVRDTSAGVNYMLN
ncbi:MAG: hypothetical protein ACREDH_13800 [Methylocella sp.]